jgi:membrane-associated phospholipid phosphatase
MLLGALLAAASAAPPSPAPYGFQQIKKDVKYVFTRPLYLDDSDKRDLLQTVFATGGLYMTREDIRDWVRDRQSPGTEQFLQNVRTMGKGAFAPALAAVFWTASYATKSPREKETAVLLLESMAFSGLGAAVGQFVIASERPETGNDVRFFRTGGHGISTDAALAASVVEPLRRQYLQFAPGDGNGAKAGKAFASALLYAGAGLTAYQRIYDDKHWAPDAFLGVMTGLTVGEALCESHGKDVKRAVRVGASAVPGGAVLTFRIDLGSKMR